MSAFSTSSSYYRKYEYRAISMSSMSVNKNELGKWNENIIHFLFCLSLRDEKTNYIHPSNSNVNFLN